MCVYCYIVTLIRDISLLALSCAPAARHYCYNYFCDDVMLCNSVYCVLLIFMLCLVM